MLSRIQHTVAYALDKRIKLPSYVVFILDDDLIQFLKYKDFGVSKMYGTWIEWLVKQVQDLFECR